MDLYVTVLVLFAALFHAAWNGLIKGGKDPLLESMLLSCVWIAICIMAVPFLPLPAVESWPLIAVSTLVHVLYFFLLSTSYKVGDFGSVYPITRGLPPLIVTVASIFIIDEQLSFYGTLGVVIIGIGILTLAGSHQERSYKTLGFAFATAIMIATYTIIDGIGARASGNSTSFLVWFSLLQSIIFVTIVFIARDKEQCLKHIRKSWRRGIVSGALSLGAYAIILWAMTKTSIPYVSALRETSVLFASIIAVFFMGEPLLRSRIVSAVLIFVGIVTINMG